MHRSLVRRTISLAFCALLAVSAASAKEIDSRGSYRGFFQSSAGQGWGLMEFVISDVSNHRFDGVLTMILGSQAEVPFPVMGTVSTSGEFTGSGKGPGGMVQFHGQIMFFDGGAAIADATYHFIPAVQMPHDQGTATLIRNFIVAPDMPPANVNGPWNGMATSAITGNVMPVNFDIRQSCATVGGRQLPGTAFDGIESLNADTAQAVKFFCQGTLAGDGRFIVIGWSLTGFRVIVTGNYAPPPTGDKPATATSQYELFFGDGSVDRGAAAIMQEFQPPDPCLTTAAP